MRSDSNLFVTFRIILGCVSSVVLLAANMSFAVMPMVFQEDDTVLSKDVRELCDRTYLAAQKQAHYLLGLVHPWEKDKTLLLLTDSKSGEHWIRPNTGAVAGLAFLYRFGRYDENVVGVSRKKLFADYNILKGRVWILVLLATLLAPYVVSKLT